jgi:hypothetical protein
MVAASVGPPPSPTRQANGTNTSARSSARASPARHTKAGGHDGGSGNGAVAVHGVVHGSGDDADAKDIIYGTDNGHHRPSVLAMQAEVERHRLSAQQYEAIAASLRMKMSAELESAHRLHDEKSKMHDNEKRLLQRRIESEQRLVASTQRSLAEAQV